MRAYLNTSTGLLTAAAGATQPIRRIDAKRGDLVEIEVMPSSALDDDATGLLACKPRGTYTGGVVALDPAWTAPAISGEGYKFLLWLNTEELDALFGDATTEVVLMAEISWNSAGITRSSNTFDVVVAADVWKGNEAAPARSTAPLGYRLTSPDGSQWDISINNDGQIVRTKIP